MFDPQAAREMAKQFADALPSNLKNVSKELETYFYQSLQQFFNKMDLVTREEFDIQTQVLAKTRAKLEALEARVKALEAQ